MYLLLLVSAHKDVDAANCAKMHERTLYGTFWGTLEFFPLGLLPVAAVPPRVPVSWSIICAFRS